MINNGGSTEAISLPKGGGAISGIGETFSPDLFTGTGNFTVPISTSPGRSGFGPQLSLQYSTGNGNGPFGLGWKLSIPRITRKTEKGLPRYTDEDVFVLSGTEDLVLAGVQLSDNAQPAGFSVTGYRPRTEGLFAHIEKWTRTDGEDVGDIHWRIVTKDNVTNLDGKSKSARITDPDHGDHVYEWLLEETFDNKGNHILYEYVQENPEGRGPGRTSRHRPPRQGSPSSERAGPALRSDLARPDLWHPDASAPRGRAGPVGPPHQGGCRLPASESAARPHPR